MATKKTTAKRDSKYTVVQNYIDIRSVDRSPKDIQTWRNAHIRAESVYYPNRSSLYDLYADVLLDAHLSGIIHKRILTVQNKNIQFLNGDKKVDELDKFLGSRTFSLMIQEILNARLWGLSLLEFIPGDTIQFYNVPRKHVKPNKGIISKDESGDTGMDYTGMWNMLFIGEDEDLGLLLKCAPYALYKRGNMADWAQYIEIFGQPIRQMKYNPYDQQTKAELKRVLDESGSSLALMIPEGVEFELKDGKQSNGDGKLQDTFKTALNNEMSVLILGNTETTTNGGTGSQAKSEIHQQQQMEIVRSDMDYVLTVLNSDKFLAILRSYGLPVDGGSFSFAREFDFQQIKAQVEIINQVKGGGTPVDDDHIYEVTGIPKPKDYDLRKKQQEEERKAREQSLDNEDELDDKQAAKARNWFRNFFG